MKCRIHNTVPNDMLIYLVMISCHIMVTCRFKAVNKWGALGDELLDWEGRFASVINGSHDWFQVSAKGLLHYKECPGNPVVNWKEKGYLNLTDHLMVCIPNLL